MNRSDGGYDSGYSAVPCFWGTHPGSLVATFVRENWVAAGAHVLDLGCGEGKNAAALAKIGCHIDAIDCSAAALRNGQRAFTDPAISWIQADATEVQFDPAKYDISIAYGLFHCLHNSQEIVDVIAKLKAATKPGGHNIVCSFNDLSHDLSGHPGFQPTLMPHRWLIQQYDDWAIVRASDTDLTEAHPHNGIWHHHSITRLIARRPS